VDSWVSLGLLGVVVFWVGYRWFQFRAVCKRLPAYLRAGAVVVDVRTPAEFAAGNFPGSRNIPLQEFSAHVESLKKEQLVLICCASGTRSGMAVRMLKRGGHRNVINAGPWQNLTRASCPVE
jgi:phage shock protein E